LHVSIFRRILSLEYTVTVVAEPALVFPLTLGND